MQVGNSWNSRLENKRLLDQFTGGRDYGRRFYFLPRGFEISNVISKKGDVFFIKNMPSKISEKTHGKSVRKLTEIQWVKLTGKMSGR